jgi:hypothetical protein
MPKIPETEHRQDHYAKTAQGARHDKDIARLEGAHKKNMDLGPNTKPDQDSYDPDQANYEGSAEGPTNFGGKAPSGDKSTPIDEL